MPGRVLPLTSAQVEVILSRHGFRLTAQRGSHRKWVNAERGLKAIVPRHSARQLPTGTLLAIMTAAEIPETEWRAS
jgi:predicted RNA binding protein YcfA (HicA-like mRNA interferase family)